MLTVNGLILRICGSDFVYFGHEMNLAIDEIRFGVMSDFCLFHELYFLLLILFCYLFCFLELGENSGLLQPRSGSDAG